MDYIEQSCKFEHEGKTFEAGGAVANEQYAIGYLKVDQEYDGARGIITDWHGKRLGSAMITARWPIRSYMSTHMHQVYALIDGKWYTGRTLGNGMIWQGKRTQSR